MTWLSDTWLFNPAKPLLMKTILGSLSIDLFKDCSEKIRKTAQLAQLHSCLFFAAVTMRRLGRENTNGFSWRLATFVYLHTLALTRRRPSSCGSKSLLPDGAGPVISPQDYNNQSYNGDFLFKQFFNWRFSHPFILTVCVLRLPCSREMCCMHPLYY